MCAQLPYLNGELGEAVAFGTGPAARSGLWPAKLIPVCGSSRLVQIEMQTGGKTCSNPSRRISASWVGLGRKVLQTVVALLSSLGFRSCWVTVMHH